MPLGSSAVRRPGFTLLVALSAALIAPPARRVIASSDLSGNESGTVVRALLVIDTKSSVSGLLSDLAAMQRLFTQANLPGVNLVVTVLTGEEVTRERILTYYRALGPRPEDTLFFYYSGHGATDPKRGHVLDLKGRAPLFRDELRTAMMACNSRLIVILTDSCSNRKLFDPNSRPGKGISDVRSPPTSLLRHLLLEHRGVVDLNASSFNPSLGLAEAAWGDPELGGLFTRALIDLLTDRKTPDDQDWPELIARLKTHAGHWYRAYRDYNLENRASLGPAEEKILTGQPSQTPQVLSAGPISESVIVTSAADKRTREGIKLGITTREDRGRLLVENVESGSPASVRGFEPGDEIVQIDGVKVSTAEEFDRAVSRVVDRGTTRFLIVDGRSGDRLLVSVRLGHVQRP